MTIKTNNPILVHQIQCDTKKTAFSLKINKAVLGDYKTKENNFILGYKNIGLQLSAFLTNYFNNRELGDFDSRQIHLIYEEVLRELKRLHEL